MRTIDLSPLYRSIVGIDRLVDLMESTNRGETGGYPPFNVEDTGEDTYRIEVAVAGFTENDLSIQVENDALTISGKRAETEGETERRYLHRGIAERSFERRFRLADHVIVQGAKLQNGLLVIDLAREVPEAKKPRQIPIGGDVKPRLVKGQAA